MIGIWVEVVVCYLLHQLKEELGQTIQIGLYRDDGLAILQGTPKEIEDTKKKICKIFKDNGLRISIEANKKIVNFLDVTLDLVTGSYYPYIKPGNTPLYINTKSNHPPSVIKAVPQGINRRLAAISSSETMFKKAIPVYQSALKASGFSNTLNYQENKKGRNGNQEKRHRKRNIDKDR